MTGSRLKEALDILIRVASCDPPEPVPYEAATYRTDRSAGLVRATRLSWHEPLRAPPTGFHQAMLPGLEP